MKNQFEIIDKSFERLIDNSELSTLATGFTFIEGPVWYDNSLLFSDIPNSRIIRYELREEGPSVNTFRHPSGNSNGMTLDLNNNLKDGEGLAVGRIGLLFVLLATAGWVAALALTLTIAGGSVPAVATQSVGAIYAAGLGINVLSSILAAIGFTFVILGLLASAKYNKNVTLLVLVLQLVTLVTSVMAGNDLSFLQTASMIAGGVYVVTVIYLANIGRSMLNEG